MQQGQNGTNVPESGLKPGIPAKINAPMRKKAGEKEVQDQ